MSNIALDTLTEKRDKLIAEKEKMTEQFEEQIKALTKTIKMLGGDDGFDKGISIDLSTYDDDNPNYIKASQEEI